MNKTDDTPQKKALHCSILSHNTQRSLRTQTCRIVMIWKLCVEPVSRVLSCRGKLSDKSSSLRKREREDNTAMRKMPKRSSRAPSLFTIKAQSSTLEMHGGEPQQSEASLCASWSAAMCTQLFQCKHSWYMMWMDGCVCLLQCEEVLVAVWQSKWTADGKTGTSWLELSSLRFFSNRWFSFTLWYVINAVRCDKRSKN